MIDANTLLQHGYEAILRAVAVGEVSGAQGLGMACARRARSATEPDHALGWARAAIACYRQAAQVVAPGFVQAGIEVPAFGLRAMLILKWGAQAGSDVLDPDDIARWIVAGIGTHESPSGFRRALDTMAAPDHIDAVALNERLQVGRSLFDRGLLPPSLAAWFSVAGLRE